MAIARTDNEAKHPSVWLEPDCAFDGTLKIEVERLINGCVHLWAWNKGSDGQLLGDLMISDDELLAWAVQLIQLYGLKVEQVTS